MCCVIFTFLNREQKVVLSHCFRPIISSFSFHFRSSYMIYFMYHLHSFLSREHMNPQLTCSQRQCLHISVGRASHRYREVTGSNPVEALNFFQASLRNCINCVHCDDHFFTFISFPQFIYDLFHISLTLLQNCCYIITAMIISSFKSIFYYYY